jgi:protein-L-isoaspartate O-methyltransferase
MDFDPAELIYVNAGVTRPLDIWLERLNDGGLLIVPLTTGAGGERLAARRGVLHRAARRRVSCEVNFRR